MGRVSRVVNRNGEVMPFRRSRVVRAILGAVRAGGSKDEWVADKLADMVVYFLDREHGDRQAPPTADDVDDMIEKALLATPDLALVARAFIESRRREAQVRDLEEPNSGTPEGPDVTASIDGVRGWNRARIAAALIRENGLDAGKAGEVAAAVETRVRGLGLVQVSTTLVRELVDVELLQRGLLEGCVSGAVSVPRFDLDQWLFPRVEGENEPAADQAELAARVSRRVLSDYALGAIFGAPQREAHLDGTLHFDRLEAPVGLTEVRLSTPALLDEGAGFGLRRHFPDAVRTPDAALARIATVVQDVARLGAPRVVLDQFDLALSPLLEGIKSERLRNLLQEGLQRAVQAEVEVSVHLSAPAGDESDAVGFALMGLLASPGSALQGRLSVSLGMNAACFADESRLDALRRAASSAVYRGQPVFRLRESHVRGGDLFGGGRSSHRALLARTAANLARPALNEAASVSSYFAEVDGILARAVETLAQRVRFLERAAMRDLPEPVSRSARMFRALVGGSRTVALAPVGLSFAAQRLAGPADAGGQETGRLLRQIASYLSFEFGGAAERHGMEGTLAWTAPPEAAPRLLREDRILAARANPESPLRLQLADPGAYLEGATLPDDCTEGRLSRESAFHNLFRDDAVFFLGGNGHAATEAELLDTLRRCVSEGGPRPASVAVHAASRLCRDCGSHFPAAAESCPACGSASWAVAPGQRSLFG